MCIRLVKFWGSLFSEPFACRYKPHSPVFATFVVNVIVFCFPYFSIGQERRMLCIGPFQTPNTYCFSIIAQHQGHQNIALDHDFSFAPNTDIPDNLKHFRNFPYPWNLFLECFYIFCNQHLCLFNTLGSLFQKWSCKVNSMGFSFWTFEDSVVLWRDIYNGNCTKVNTYLLLRDFKCIYMK